MAHCLLVLEGKCFGNPVSVLVDSGATDDFVAKHFVDSQTNAPCYDLQAQGSQIG